MSTLIDRIAEAIARMEGYYLPGSLAQRNHNPGNLRSWGRQPIVSGYAAFPNAEAGWAALRRQVQLNIDRGLTLLEFFAGRPGVYPGYAPASDQNDPVNYALFVAGRAEIPADVPLNQIESGGTDSAYPCRAPWTTDGSRGRARGRETTQR